MISRSAELYAQCEMADTTSDGLAGTACLAGVYTVDTLTEAYVDGMTRERGSRHVCARIGFEGTGSYGSSGSCYRRWRPAHSQ